MTDRRSPAQQLEALGVVDVTQRGLGWRSWYGGLWAAMKLVCARKPA